ncbi:MAG: hypothetical protein ABIW03_07255 [Sphingomicrobium sp.]
MNQALPDYAGANVKAALLAAGASGTIYSLVMPESESAFEHVLDADRPALLDLYREAWTQKQDAMHLDYFDGWFEWSRAVGCAVTVSKALTGSRIWRERYQLIQDAMIGLQQAAREGRRRDAAERHFDWLLSDSIAQGTGVPFHREATVFRKTFDELVDAYDKAMRARDQTAVRGRGER